MSILYIETIIKNENDIYNRKDNKMDVSKLLLNPSRLRILQYFSLYGEATASDVCKSMQDIPKATAYRHIKMLEDSDLLQVVKENRVRGATEKVYSINKEALPLNDSENMSLLVSAYFIGLMRDMELYLKRNDADVKRDKIFFNSAILNVSDEEYKQMLDKLSLILKEYMEFLPAENRKMRKLSIISSFPTE